MIVGEQRHPRRPDHIDHRELRRVVQHVEATLSRQERVGNGRLALDHAREHVTGREQRFVGSSRFLAGRDQLVDVENRSHGTNGSLGRRGAARPDRRSRVRSAGASPSTGRDRPRLHPGTRAAPRRRGHRGRVPHAGGRRSLRLRARDPASPRLVRIPGERRRRRRRVHRHAAQPPLRRHAALPRRGEARALREAVRDQPRAGDADGRRRPAEPALLDGGDLEPLPTRVRASSADSSRAEPSAS